MFAFSYRAIHFSISTMLSPSIDFKSFLCKKRLCPDWSENNPIYHHNSQNIIDSIFNSRNMVLLRH
jgi:hypothetical protein